MLKVICGANIKEGDYSGKSLRELKDILQDELNIPAECKVLVNGEEQNLDYVLRGEDTPVEFIKQSGDKG